MTAVVSSVVPMVLLSGAALQRLDAAGRPLAEPEPASPDRIAQLERDQPRWIWAGTEAAYLPLLDAGSRLRRCHDIELVEGLLLADAGRYGEPRSAAAAYARLMGAPVPPDSPLGPAEPPGRGQGTLFGPAPGPPLSSLRTVYGDQLARIGKVAHPGKFRLLTAAESAGALIAAEMGWIGLPWRSDVHDELLIGLLGRPSPVKQGQPERLAQLAAQIGAALNAPGVHPDSPAELRQALRRAGIDVADTRSWTLNRVDHPAAALLVEYRELYRIWTAHGWSWREQWVRGGRFHPAYIPAGVVSGRWATRGGGALQIPKAVRGAVRAEPGWRLVVADAAQLEPRILAAVSADEGLTRASSAGDLYQVLAGEAFGGERAHAKLALLGAMYGQTGGAAAPALAALRNRYPRAWEHVETAARTGENGGLVRSWLGRTSPPAALDGSWTDEGASGRAWGRFTRNFVIQATAAEWAACWLGLVRDTLWGTPAELVFFLHDEVIVHCPASLADAVSEALQRAAQRAGVLLFGDWPTKFPLNVAVVESYADAK